MIERIDPDDPWDGDDGTEHPLSTDTQERGHVGGPHQAAFGCSLV